MISESVSCFCWKKNYNKKIYLGYGITNKIRTLSLKNFWQKRMMMLRAILIWSNLNRTKKSCCLAGKSKTTSLPKSQSNQFHKSNLDNYVKLSLVTMHTPLWLIKYLSLFLNRTCLLCTVQLNDPVWLLCCL